MRRRPSNAPDPGPQLARLRRRHDVRSLSKIARALGMDAWLVGGAVRDAYLGIADTEIDAAVSGDAEAVARALEAAGAGRAVFLSRDRPGPRVFRVAGRRPLDIAELEGGSIEADLGRRDFTVNAIALPVAAGAVLDPFGGIPDLARGSLRLVKASNLLEDPLRALRAARLMATHGLVPDRATLAAARAAAPLLPRVAAERVGAELSRILGSPHAAGAMGWAARAGILAATLGLGPESRGSARLLGALRALDDFRTSRLPEAARRRLRLAALALSLRLDPARGRKWLSERRLPRSETDDAARILELASRLPAGDSEKEAWRWIVEAGSLGTDALHLLSRHPRPSVRRRLVLARLRRHAGRKLRSVPVSGKDVMDWLGIPAGPQVGALLNELAVAAASGQVKNRREARNWLTGQVQEASSAL